MKRQSLEQVDFDLGGALTDKWVVPDIPNPPPPPSKPIKPLINESYVEFEDLNTLGTFSFNRYNKEVEVSISYDYWLM